MKKPGGYQNLIVYQQAVVIYDLTVLFCKTYMTDKTNMSHRTVDQMIQAARSGKQNIVEGSLEKSSKLNINLNSVSRASFGELLEDFKDYLRTYDLKLWDKNDPRVLEIRANKQSLPADAGKSNSTNWSNWTNNPEGFCNLMITLLSRENYLLDQMLRSLEQKFIHEGGYSENLFLARRRALQEASTNSSQSRTVSSGGKKRLAQRKLDR